jgi:hypothetical protein
VFLASEIKRAHFEIGSGEFSLRKWQFGQTWDQRWYWRQLNDDGTQKDSAATFDRQLECIADACDHGYLEPQTTQSIFLARDLPPEKSKQS